MARKRETTTITVIIRKRENNILLKYYEYVKVFFKKNYSRFISDIKSAVGPLTEVRHLRHSSNRNAILFYVVVDRYYKIIHRVNFPSSPSKSWIASIQYRVKCIFQR